CARAGDDYPGAAIGLLASSDGQRRHTRVSLQSRAVDEKGGLVAPGDFAGQVKATCENMRRILAKAGGSLDDIVTITVYTTERRWGEIFTDMRKDVFKTGYPSSAFVEARKLRTPGAFLEIQAIAVLRE